MVYIRNGLLNHIGGRLRELVFYTRAGRTFARSFPRNVHNPQTPLQQQQRSRMRDVMALYMVVKQSPLIRIWQQAGRERGMLAMNLFVKLNIAAFTGGGRVADYAKLHFSCGCLPRCDCLRAVYQAGTATVLLSWENAILLNDERYTDHFMAVVLFPDDEFKVFTDTKAGYKRRDGGALVALPEGYPPPREIYCFFADAGCKSYSDDVCCHL